MKYTRVGIVGGGPAGLMTTYELQRIADCPVQVTLFEASNRLGGKVITPQFRHAAIPSAMIGVELSYSSQFGEDPLKKLIAELGLSISPMAGSAVITNNRVLANLDDIGDHLRCAGMTLS